MSLTSLPKPFGGGRLLELDDDQQTLLAVGRDNRASLYDFGAGIRLGDPMYTTAPVFANGAHPVVNWRRPSGATYFSGEPQTASCASVLGSAAVEPWATTRRPKAGMTV